MSRRVEAILDFAHLKYTVAIGVKLVESLVDQTSSDLIEFTAKSSNKLIKTNLSVTITIKASEKTLSITRAHAWDSETVKHGLEFGHA